MSPDVRVHNGLHHAHDMVVVDGESKIVAPLYQANPLLRVSLSRIEGQLRRELYSRYGPQGVGQPRRKQTLKADRRAAQNWSPV